jgi:uncharacterized membrane protein YbhN (UPF0104 family)
MKLNLKKIISLLLPIALGVFLIIYAYHKFEPEEIAIIKQQFVQADYTFIFLSLLFNLVALWSRATRWNITLQHLGYTSKGVNRFFAVCISYLMNMTIPRSGELSRALFLKKYDDVPVDKSFGSIIGERLVDLIFLVSFIVLAFVVQFEILKKFVLDQISFSNLIIIGSVLALIGSVGLYLYLKSTHPKILWLKNKISGLVEGFLSITQLQQWKAFWLHSFLIWFCYFAMFYITIFALPETSNLSLGGVLMAFIVGGLAITLTNSGFGTYPFLIAEILVFYAIPSTAGTSFGWIVWTSQTLFIVLLGSISFILAPILNQKN